MPTLPPPCLTLISNGVRLILHVQPRASRTELAGLHGGALKIRVAATPVDGAANAELMRFLTRLLDVPLKAGCLTAGQTGRRKTVEVTGVDYKTARQRLGLCT